MQDEAFYALVREVVKRIKEEHHIEDRWLAPEAAMKMLNISSRSYLQKLRDSGSIRFSQPAKRVILYDRLSIEEHLEKHAKNAF